MNEETKIGDLKAAASKGGHTSGSTYATALVTAEAVKESGLKAQTTEKGDSNDGKEEGKDEDKKKKKEKKKTVPLCTLFFRYATYTDMAMMLFGTIAAIITG